MISFSALFKDSVNYIKQDKLLLVPYWMYMALLQVLMPYLPILDLSKSSEQIDYVQYVYVLAFLFIFGLIPKFFVLIHTRFLDGETITIAQGLSLFLKYMSGVLLFLMGSLGVLFVLIRSSELPFLGFVLFVAALLFSFAVLAMYMLFPVAVVRFDYSVKEAYRRVYYLCKAQWRVLLRLSLSFSFFILVATLGSFVIAQIPLLGPSVLTIVFQGAYSTVLVLIALNLYRKLLEPEVLVELKD
jgi:hypothetical protein